MFKVTGENTQQVSMDIYYLFGRDLQVQFKNNKLLDNKALYFKHLTDEAKQHIKKNLNCNIRKVKDFV